MAVRAWQHDLELVQRRRWITSDVLCVSLLVIVLDNSILNVALLPMSATMIVFAPMSARFVERVGTKIVVGAGLLITAVSLLLQIQFLVTSSVGLIIGVTMVLGLEMANVMAPATESIMGSLPRAEAGVGSALNDTTRQVGGAIGVALLGSLLSSRYLTHVNQGLAGTSLPAGLHARITGNVGPAVEIGKQIGGPAGMHLQDVAKSAFVSGMHLAVIVAAVIILVAAVGEMIWLPARGTDPESTSPTVATATDQQ